jgi:rsbT co-antagonist protein RsbR
VVGLSMLSVITIGVLQSLSPPLAGFLAQRGVSAVPIAQVVGFYIVITTLVALLLDRFGGALREALASSLEREEELRGIRASLESSVAARTAELQAALRDVQAQSAEQRRLLAENDQQRTMLQELSVPVIPISADTLVMPLVGALDSARLLQLQEQSLRALERSSARTLVLDITGVPVVDSQVAQGLLMTVRSARLLGANVVLVGIRPEVAQTIVGLGIDLRDVRTYSDLHSALSQSLV